MEAFACVQDEAVALSVVCCVVSSLRPKSTPTPTASSSVNGMPMEAVDYERLKQVELIQHQSPSVSSPQEHTHKL